MAITETEKVFIDCLKGLGVDTEAIVAIMLLLKTEEQLGKMANFLCENREATDEDMVIEALRITGHQI